MTKDEANSFILVHYNRDLTAAVIAARLAIPRKTVITRYAILTGRRKGNRYTRRDGTTTIYYDPRDNRTKHRSRAGLLQQRNCKHKPCQALFSTTNRSKLFCDDVCRKAHHDAAYVKRKRDATRRGTTLCKT